MPRTGYVANAIYINLALIALKTNLFKFSTHDYFFSSEDRRLLLYVIDNQWLINFLVEWTCFLSCQRAHIKPNNLARALGAKYIKTLKSAILL